MALSTEISLEDLVSQFRGLNLNEPETWPIAPRILFMILSAVLVIGLGWQLYWSGKFDERDAKRTSSRNSISAIAASASSASCAPTSSISSRGAP